MANFREAFRVLDLPSVSGESQALTLAKTSWQVPEIRPSFIFQIATMVKNSKEKEKAHFHIGNPPISEAVREMQRQKIWADPRYQEIEENLPQVVKKVFGWINTTVVNNVTAYGPDGGGSGDNATIVSGGRSVAEDLISRVLQASIPKSEDPSPKLEVIHLDPADDDEVALNQIVERIVNASNKGNFIHLVIQDSSKITDSDLREGLINLAKIGRTIITDVISDSVPGDGALSKDTDIGSLVLTLHNSPLANACGISAVLGDGKLVNSIQGLHTQLYGSPSTTQTDLYALLSDEAVAREILAIRDDEIQTLGEENEFLARLMTFLKLTLLGNGQSLATRDQDINTRQQDLAGFAHDFYFKGTDMKMVVNNGGGRAGLKSIAEYAVEKKGIRRVAVLSPHWTYNNVFKEPLEIVDVRDCFDDKGGVDLVRLDEQLQVLSDSGKLTNLSLVVESGGRNPNGTVYNRETKKEILKICERYGIQVWDDAAYFHMELEDEDRHSFAEVAGEMINGDELASDFEKNIYTVFTFTKMPTMAGARLNATGSTDQEFISWLKGVQEREASNNLGILLAHQLLSDSGALAEREDILREDVRARFEIVQEKLTAASIKFSPAGGAFYQTATIPGLNEENSKRIALELAKIGIGFVPMIIFGGPANQVRLALGGDRTPEQIGEQMDLLITYMQNQGLLD